MRIPRSAIGFRPEFGQNWPFSRLRAGFGSSRGAVVTGENAVLKPPTGLGAIARRWWSDVVELYEIDGDPGATRLLTDACRVIDRLEGLRKAIDRDGIVTMSRLGERQVNPLIREERQQRAELRQILTRLGLESEESQPDLRYARNRALRGRR
jgi:phage terminase small subunit